MRHLILLVLFTLGSTLSAQVTGAPTSGDLSLNGQGAGATSPVLVPVNGGALTISLTASNNVGRPLILATADFVAAGWLPLGSNSDGVPQTLDLDLFTTEVVLDGTGAFSIANPLIPLLAMPNDGTPWTLVGNQPARGVVLQAAILSTGAFAGFDVSQAITAIDPFGSSFCSGGTNLSPITDDGYVLVPFGGSVFSFYGTSYSQCFVNMNGFITFGGGVMDFTPTELEMLNGPPRIAPVWDDWSPNSITQGTVRSSQTPQGTTVEWFNVRHYGACAGGLDTNTFCVRLNYSTGDIFMDYGFMGLCQAGFNPSSDQIVGISPGGGLSAAANLDLSAGPHTALSPLGALYEDFGQGSFGPFDLGGTVNGGPNMTDWISTGGTGIGPYQVLP